MEVQARPVDKPVIAALAARWPALVAGAAVLAVSTVIVVAQPLRSPWWTYADADATYTAASLDLLLGAPPKYLDHPGLPLEELGAVAFGIDYLAARATGRVDSRQEYVDEMLLDLDRARPIFRGLAAAFFISGALLSFLLVGRLLGHWTWGLAAGLLWIAAPGLAPMSIQFRIDVPLAVFSLVVAYLIGRAVQTRSAVYFGAAGLALGLAMMVKMHAGGLLVALAIAAAWRHPLPGWWPELRRSAADWAAGRRYLLLAVGVPWLLVAVTVNWGQFPFDLTAEMAFAAAVPPLFVGAYFLAGSQVRGRMFDPFYAFVAGSVLAGLALPGTLDVPDGLRSLVNIVEGLSGGGVNEDIALFAAPLDQLADFPLRQATFVFLLAGVAALVGLRRSEPLPVVLFAGALFLAVMAQARLAAVHYFAPAFVVSVPAALWVLRGRRGGAASLLVWPIVLFLVWPQIEHRDHPARDAQSFADRVAPSLALIEQRLQPGEVALLPSYWPNADVRYFAVVQYFVGYAPTYPYRFLEAAPLGLQLAAELGLRPRYYTGPSLEGLSGEQEIQVGNAGTYLVRPVPGAREVVELLSGPGITPP